MSTEDATPESDLGFLRIKVYIKLQSLIDKYMLTNRDGYKSKSFFAGYFERYLKDLNKKLPKSNDMITNLAEAFQKFKYYDHATLKDGILKGDDKQTVHTPGDKNTSVKNAHSSNKKHGTTEASSNAKKISDDTNRTSYEALDKSISEALHNDQALGLLKNILDLDM